MVSCQLQFTKTQNKFLTLKSLKHFTERSYARIIKYGMMAN